MRDWHLGQQGLAATRGDKANVCGLGMDASRKNQAGALPNSLSSMNAGTVRWPQQYADSAI